MIDILLATYNGAPYLPAQLASLDAQTNQDWRLLIRDDHSTDETLALLATRASTDSRYHLLPPGPNLGITGNFSALMQASTADYIMCCDQDDVWHPDKIQRTLETMRALELVHGKDTPLLIHTDARLVSEDLTPLHPSFYAMRRLAPAEAPLSRLLAQNVVTGCTMMLNRALLALAAPIPREALMHDYWAALVAAACGHIFYLNQPTLDYRQHPNNAIGARGTRLQHARTTTQRLLNGHTAQAEALIARAGHLMPETHLAIATHFITLKNKSPLARKIALLTGHHLRRPYYENLPILALL